MKNRNKKNITKLTLLVGVFILLFFISSTTSAMNVESEEKGDPKNQNFKLGGVEPFPQQRVHRVGLLQLSVTNWGIFGSQMRDSKREESVGGCFIANPDEEVEAPSAEFPVGSELEYLFQGAIWIGATEVVEKDTFYYATVGCDGWLWIYEMWPDGPKPKGAIQERSARPNSRCYSPDAVSEQDIIAVYTDTSADIPLSPWEPELYDWDNRKHHPLNIQITQKSYSWSYEYAQDFVLMDFSIKNIGFRRLINVYMGLYVDADVQHLKEDQAGPYGPQDDICGFRRLVPKPKGEYWDTINIAWIADNDGHGDFDEGQRGKVFTSKSPIAVTGVRVVRTPKPEMKYSFNWWISNQTGAPRDWGPWMKRSQDRWEKMNPYGSANNFPDNVLGTPGGDVSKYFIMSNEEFDYDQIYSCIWPSLYPDSQWLPPNEQMCGDLANGFDTRYLLSFGPFDEILPGESLLITIAYVAGENFHVDPGNLRNDPDLTNPDRFYENIDFADFATNATWAAKVYDKPEPPDYKYPDGIPDFTGPPPPPSPQLTFENQRGKVKIKWNGMATEKNRDFFNGRLDFEGYRIYMSRTGLPNDYALLGSFDKLDYRIFKLNRAKMPPEWEWKVASISLDSLKLWYQGKGYENFGDDPALWTKNRPFVIKAWADRFFIKLSDLLDQNGKPVIFDSLEVAPLDSFYFEHHDWNVGFDPIVVNKAYRDSVDLKLIKGDIDSSYYDYEYEIEVFPGEPLYFAVTAFDVGDPQTDLDPLESSKQVNATLVYSIDSPELVKQKKEKVVVYPNPYRIDGNYVASGYEPGTGAFDKRINFINLPPKCTIRIYTLDGDLVRTIHHYTDESDPNASYEYWDLISRNTQAVVSGIYLFTVKDRQTGQNQVGKFVIIK